MFRMYVLMLVSLTSFSVAFSQEGEEAIERWKQALEEVEATKEIVSDYNKVLKGLDRKTDNKKIQETRKELADANKKLSEAEKACSSAFKEACQKSSRLDVATIWLPTIATNRWFEHSQRVFDIHPKLLNIPQKDPAFTPGMYFGFRSLHQGSRTVFRGAFGEEPSFPNGIVHYNAILIATTSDSQSGIGIEADREPEVYFLQLNEKQTEVEEKKDGEYKGRGEFEKLSTFKLVFEDELVKLSGKQDKVWQFVPPGKGIFLILPNQVNK